MTVLTGEATLETAPISRIIQLSDTHLMQQPGGELVGIDTDRSFAAVCRMVAAQPPIDALLLTGDLAGDEAEAAYLRLRDALAPLNVPSFWLPGNHDALWQATHPLNQHFKRSIRFPDWEVLMLNTQQPGKVEGHLSQHELEQLSAAVARAGAAGRPLLVATHHPLIGVGCDWLDEQIVANGKEALALLVPMGARAVVVSGHVHQASQQTYRGVTCMTAPSTCVQFAPNSPRFSVDAAAPGCRLLELHDDGRWETRVLRVTDEIFTPDLASRGYA